MYFVPCYCCGAKTFLAKLNYYMLFAIIILCAPLIGISNQQAINKYNELIFPEKLCVGSQAERHWMTRWTNITVAISYYWINGADDTQKKNSSDKSVSISWLTLNFNRVTCNLVFLPVLFGSVAVRIIVGRPRMMPNGFVLPSGSSWPWHIGPFDWPLL